VILLAYRWISMRVNGSNYNREKKIQKTINWYLKGMYRPRILSTRKELLPTKETNGEYSRS
jgi:hypothetical protein